jgi:hypothetical protein
MMERTSLLIVVFPHGATNDCIRLCEMSIYFAAERLVSSGIPEFWLLAWERRFYTDVNRPCAKETSMPRNREPNGVEPDFSEDDIQREQFGPRGVPGRPDPAKMTPQRDKKTPKHIDQGHTS